MPCWYSTFIGREHTCLAWTVAAQVRGSCENPFSNSPKAGFFRSSWPSSTGISSPSLDCIGVSYKFVKRTLPYSTNTTGHLGSRIRCNPVPFDVQHPWNDSKVFRGKRVIRQLHLQSSTGETQSGCSVQWLDRTIQSENVSEDPKFTLNQRPPNSSLLQCIDKHNLSIYGQYWFVVKAQSQSCSPASQRVSKCVELLNKSFMFWAKLPLDQELITTEASGESLSVYGADGWPIVPSLFLLWKWKVLIQLIFNVGNLQVKNIF